MRLSPSNVQIFKDLTVSHGGDSLSYAEKSFRHSDQTKTTFSHLCTVASQKSSIRRIFMTLPAPGETPTLGNALQALILGQGWLSDAPGSQGTVSHGQDHTWNGRFLEHPGLHRCFCHTWSLNQGAESLPSDSIAGLSALCSPFPK